MRHAVQNFVRVLAQAVLGSCSRKPWWGDRERARVSRWEQGQMADGVLLGSQPKQDVEQETKYDQQARAAEAGLVVPMKLGWGLVGEMIVVRQPVG